MNFELPTLFIIAIPALKIALRHQSKPFLTRLVDGPLCTVPPIVLKERENKTVLKLIYIQRFIQAVLMSSRRHKKLNLPIKFSNSIFIKCDFKAYWH